MNTRLLRFILTNSFLAFGGGFFFGVSFVSLMLYYLSITNLTPTGILYIDWTLLLGGLFATVYGTKNLLILRKVVAKYKNEI